MSGIALEVATHFSWLNDGTWQGPAEANSTR